MGKNNVWLHKMGSDLEKNIIDYFTSNNLWGNVIWHEAEFQKLRYNDVEINKLYDQHEFINIPEEIYNHVYDYLYTYIDMYIRLSPWAVFIYDQKNIHDYLNIFNRDVNFIYQLLTEKEIDLVIFFRTPHLGGDLLLYLLAEKMGIKTLILEQSPFTNKFYHFFDLKDFGTFETSKKISDFEEVEIPQRFDKELWFMDSIYQKHKKSFKNILRNSLRPEYRLIKESFKHRGWEQSLYRYSLRKKYKKNINEIVDENIDLNKPYIYFPLHMQPEMTTSAWGGKYNDQLLALERLAKKLPDGWHIYVKENPAQNFYMRGEYFFKRLKTIPGVKVVPTSMNTYKLLANSKLAATITGTVGWEAITGGKNVIVFGWGVWYKKLPGVFQYHESLDINEIVNYEFEHSQLENKVAELQTKMGKGIVYPFFRKGYSDYDDDENKKSVLINLEKILYQ